MVLLYDLLLGKGIQCGGPMKRFLVNHKVELLAAFRRSVDQNSGVVPSSGMYYTKCTCVKFAPSLIYVHVLRLRVIVYIKEKDLLSCIFGACAEYSCLQIPSSVRERVWGHGSIFLGRTSA